MRPVFRYSSRSSVSEEHLMGPFVPVCHSVSTRKATRIIRGLLLRNNGRRGTIVGAHCATMGTDVSVERHCCASDPESY
jgi:hypothetical protein